MHKWMHSAAGGTIQRLNPGLAIVWLRSKIDKRAIARVHPFTFRGTLARPSPSSEGGDRLPEIALKITYSQPFGNAPLRLSYE